MQQIDPLTKIIMLQGKSLNNVFGKVARRYADL